MMKKIKLFHLIGSIAIGGAERFVLGLLNNLDRSRFDTCLYSFGKHRNATFLRDFQSIEELYFVDRPARGFYNPQTFLSILRSILLLRPDIIHTHLRDADIFGRIAGEITGTPVISTFQNVPHTYDSHRWDQRVLARFTARNMTTHSVAVSNHIRQLFIERWRLPPEKISTIYNAVAVDTFAHIPIDDLSRENKPVTITNIASLTKQKAHHLLLEAAQMVLAVHPDTRFMIVGQGDLEQPLKAQAARMGLTERVIFTGVRRDIPEVLAQSDIFTLSSLWEGLPLAAIEAMAAGRAVVVTDVGGNRELVEHDKHGLVVPPDDARALADAYITLIEDRDKRFALASAAREYVTRVFAIQTITNQYEALYYKLLEKPIK